jgi:D-Tyr-tRNAtyr deacylase
MLYEKDKALEAIEALEDGAKIEVMTPAEKKELLDNYKLTEVETEVNKRIGERVSEIYSQIDEDVYGVIGVKKGDNEKTYDYVKSQLAALKEKAEKKGGDESEELKKVRKQLQDLAREKSEEVERLKSEMTISNRMSKLREGLAKLNFNEHIPESILKETIDKRIKDLAESATETEDGKYRYKSNGVDILENYAPVTEPEKVLGIVFKDMLGEARAAGGGGGKPPKPRLSGMSPEDATKQIIEEGIPVTSKEGVNRFRELTGGSSDGE